MENQKRDILERIKINLLDRKKYLRTVRFSTFLILAIVGVGMTVLNILTPGIGFYDLLTWTTGIFSILSFVDMLISLFGEKPMKVVSFIFAIQLIAMFTIFVISGKPDGFSAIWICLVPLASMIFYGRKNGSILSAIMFVILVLFFWVKIQNIIPFFKYLNVYNGYNDTFCKRYPILYLSFFAVSLLLQFIQDFQFGVLEKVNQLNEKYSTHDQLTGLFNRKGFYDALEKRIAEKSYSKVGFVIFDLDHFKKLNDAHGHNAGDKVLSEFANILNESLENVISCRWGGEEFLVCYFDDAILMKDLELLRQRVQKYEFVYDDIKMKITISGGAYETNDKNLNNKLMWLNKADEALYKAKESGRNRIIYY